MCKEREDETGHQSHYCKAHEATASPVFCELCGLEASLYCQADEAFLCHKCDRWVHGANFLAQRHIRFFLCGTCRRRLTLRYLIGTSSEVRLRVADVNLPDTSNSLHSNPEERTNDSRVLKEPFKFL